MADEIIRLDYSAKDIGDNIDEVRTARGTYESLDARLDEIEGGGFTPTTEQLAAMNSGITAERLATDENNILTVADQSTQYNYMDFNSYGTGNSGTIDSINTTTNTITVSGKAAWAKGIIYLNNVPSGTYRLKYTVSSNSSASAAITMNEGSTQKTSKVWNNTTGDYTSGEITFGDNAKSLYITANNSTSTLTNSVTITITNVMLIPASVYNAGFTDYQPYALSNATITPALKECVDNGVKNKVHVDNSGTFTASGSARSYDIPINVTGDIAISFGSLTSTDTDSDSCAIVFLNSSNVGFLTISMNRGNSVSEIVKLTDTATKVRLYPASSYNESSGDTVTWNNLMICDESLWKVSPTYQPYALSNAELTSDISSINTSRFKMVAHASAQAATSLEYTTNVADFDAKGTSDRTSGNYMVVCTNWSETPAPYIGLISFSGGNTAKFVKTDVVTGFTPTITITQNVANATINISGAGRISIYAIL